jgi:hypothetical protein
MEALGGAVIVKEETSGLGRTGKATVPGPSGPVSLGRLLGLKI